MTTCCCQGEKHHQTCKKITFSLIRPGMIFVYVFLRSFELQKSLRKTLSLILLNPYKTFKNIFEFRDNSIRFISCSTRLRRYETRGFFLLNQFRRFFQFLEDFVRHKRLKICSWPCEIPGNCFVLKYSQPTQNLFTMITFLCTAFSEFLLAMTFPVPNIPEAKSISYIVITKPCCLL